MNQNCLLLSGKVCATSDEYEQLLDQCHHLCHRPGWLFEFYQSSTAPVVDKQIKYQQEWYFRSGSLEILYDHLLFRAYPGQQVDMAILDPHHQNPEFYRLHALENGWRAERFQTVRRSRGPWFDFDPSNPAFLQSYPYPWSQADLLEPSTVSVH